MAKIRIAKAFTIHHVKLIIRLILLLATIGVYVASDFKSEITDNEILFGIIWVFLFITMIERLVPMKSESIGSEKQFEKHFRPAKKILEKLTAPNEKRALFVALVWIAVNAVFGFLYIKGIFDTGIMFIITMLYAVGDMVCVIYYCPFQQLLGNRCCTTCRIYNWDSIMMVTPLIFVKNVWTFILVVMAIIIFIRWEYTLHKHTERFLEKTNLTLRCINCPEKYCTRRIKFPKNDILGDIKKALKK